MGSLGHNDDESRRNKSNPNHIDSTDTEIQNDSQFPPSPVRGEKIKDGDAGEQQLTERMVSPDDAVSLEKDAFLAGETQVLDDPEECDGEVAVDSEGEGTDRTEVLSETDGFSDDDDTVREVDSHQVDEKTQYASLRKHDEKGLREEAELTVELRSSGSLTMPFMSVHAASLRASGLAAHSMASMGTNSGSSCSLNGNQSLKPSAVDGNGMSGIQIPPRVREDVDQDHDHDLEKYIEEVDKFRVGCSTARKLFREDTLEDTISNAEVEANSPQLPSFENELAGLSYVDSQEPGDLSQANALDVVDRFIKASVLEFDHEVDHGKINAKKSNPASSAKRKQSLSKRSNIRSTVGKAGTSAKGQQSLAKRADIRNTVGKAGIYEWDDSREDEGGGASLFKRKEEIFDGRGHSKRTFTQPRKPKRSIEDEFKKEQLNIGNKIMGLSHSDSKFVLRNSEENRKTVEAADLKIRKNLVTELNEASEQLDLNVGVDTQMAAEAMEALFNGEPLANHDSGDACRDGQTISKGSCKGYSGGETKSKVPSKNPSSSKRSCPDSEIVTRQSQKRKRSDAKSSKESNTSLRKSTRNVRKAIDAELVKEKPNRAKSNAEKPLACSGSENWDKTLLKTVEQRNEGTVEVDGINSTAKSSGSISLKTNTCTPIAQRTRRCRVLHQLDRTEDASNDSREEMSCQVPKDKRKRSGNGVDAFKLSSAKDPKVASNQSDDIENTTPGDLERPVPKLTAKTGDVGTDALSYPKGKRSRRNLSGQVNGSRNLDGPCKPSVGQEAIGQSITRKKRSKSNARRTLTDVDIKRTTRSSAGKLSQPKSGKPDLGGAALNCDSADMNEKMIPKGQMGLGPSKHFDMECEAVPTSSIEGADQSARLEVSPRESCKVSNSACTTPVNRVPRMNSASPVCMGNEYFKQSCKKNLSRSSLMKEINSLIPTVPESTFAFKDSRRRRDMANVRVLFSHHLDEDTIKHQKKILARLGASIAASISDATHFITDVFVRTRNMLEAIACGKPVVTHLWLESCNQTSCLIDEKNYILRDAKKEKELGFSMPVSLVRACQHPLLQGRRVFITPNTKPGKEIIADLVKAVHGQAVERLGRSVLNDDKIPDDLLVISCEEDYTICMPFLEKGAAVYSSELLLNGIVIQKLEYERHRLFEDHVRRTRSTVWTRKDGKRFQAVTKCK